MTTGVNCTVLIDGVRLQDGSPGDDLDEPVALDDLAVTWGRDDTMSQPESDTCTFSVMDAIGDGGGLRAFLTAIRTGSRVDVIARGDVSPTPSRDTFVNPGFESSTVTWSATNAGAARSTVRAWAGSYSLAVSPTNAAAAASVILAPAAFSAPGTNPDAWDAIATTTAGQSWRATVHAWVPTGATLTVRPVTFTGPYVASATAGGIPVSVAGDGTWQTIEFEYAVQSDGRWVGLQATLDPTGPAWDDMPSTLTWDAVDPALSWDDLGTLYLDDVQVSTPSEGIERGVLVFAGRITSLSAAWDDTADAPVIDVVANGFTADLENRSVGDEPWPVEDVEARSTRILDLVGLPIAIDVDTSLADTLLSWRDVDSQGASGLLKEVASSVDGVLWPAVHQALGAYLRLEDPAMRASLLHLVELIGPPPEVVHTNLATNPDAEAFGAVSTHRTNLALDPAMTTAWFVGAGSLPASTAGTTDPFIGSTFRRFTAPPTGGTASDGVDSSGSVSNAPQVAVGPVTATVWVRSTQAITLRPAAIHAAGAGFAYTLQSNVTLVPGVWTPVAFSGSATVAGVLGIRLRVQTGVMLAANGTLDIGAVQVEQSLARPREVIWGGAVAAGDFTYAWSGAANASTSLQRAPTTVGYSPFSGQNGARWSSVSEHTRGARSFAVLRTQNGTTGLIWSAPGTVLAGQWVTIRARVKGVAGVNFGVSARTSGGGGAAGVNYTASGDWQDVYTSGQAGTDGALTGGQITINTNGGLIYVDEVAVLVEGAPYVGPYFDGRTPSTPTAAYAWTGPADASTSTWSTVQTHTIVIEPVNPDEGFDLSACLIERDPVTWVQDVSDVVTRVAVTWKLQGVDDEGNPTTEDVTERIVDSGLESRHGTRAVSLSSQLQDATDALHVAEQILARTSSDAWRAEGLTVDDDDVYPTPVGVALMLDLLDGTSRIGAPIVIGDMPEWAPSGTDASVYLEGGTYRFVGGRWVLDLLVSASTGVGESAAWDELDPDWQWDQWSPDITWDDLRGVAAPSGG